MTGDSLHGFNSLPLAVRYTIDQLCTRFEAAWRAGEEPSLESYLGEVGADHQPVLLAELLPLDLEYRRERGDNPTAQAYTARFPHLDAVVRAAFGPRETVTGADTPLAASPATWFLGADRAESPQPALSADGDTSLPQVPGFDVLAELGQGGMGVVYKARQVGLNRLVALKMIRPRGPVQLQELVRFRLEAEAVAQLRHPNIVPVYDSGEHQGQPFLVLELVEGGSLKQLTGSAPLPPRSAAALVETLARAIHHAHCRGIVHRDLKPANILLEPPAKPQAAEPSAACGLAGAVPRITDFGLAKRLGEDSWQTQEGDVLGTPIYMAPEQAVVGRTAIGPGADVYALGVILYELLTGQVPLEGKDAFATLVLVQFHEPPAPRQVVPKLPRDLETICLKCLQKEPAQRYATAQDLADDLRAFLLGEPIRARPTGAVERAWKWTRRNPLLASLLTATASLLVAVAVISTVAAVQLRRERNAILAERERTRLAEESSKLALVDALLIAAPDSVPYLLQTLDDHRELAVPRLRRTFADGRADPALRLRAAIALTAFGEPQTRFLLDAVPTASPAESGNLALAFRAVPASEVTGPLRQRVADSPDLTHRARCAILLLDLGDVRAAAELLALSADPAARSALIDVFPSWHGRLAVLPALVRRCEDEACRSGLCAALGRVAPAALPPGVRAELARVLGELYRDAPDGGTHSAAGWALRQWRVTLPALVPSAGPTGGRRWFVNRSGLTLVGLPPGAFVAERGSVTVVTRPVFLSDREVSVALFRRFIGDPAYPADRKPTDWPGPARAVAPEDDCPVNNVNREDTLLFCNWLSAREGRRACYRRAGPGRWVCDFTADGYRLPTEAEWDHAHRAGAGTLFFCGDDPRWLPLYAQISGVRTLPGGSKLPNRWGLFDMVGNLWETCWDYRAPFPPGLAFDPVGSPSGPSWVSRGGAYDSGSYDCQAMHRLEHGDARQHSRGFRVACGPLGRPTRTLSPLEALTRGLEMLPDNPHLLRARGALHARATRWKAAAADLARALEQAPDDPSDWTGCAALLAQTGDRQAYRRHCAKMLRRFAAPNDPLVDERVAKACLLLPGALADLGPVVKLTDRALAAGDGHWACRYFELARGLAEYRRGNCRAALKWLGRSQAPAKQVLSRYTLALSGFVQALAHHHLKEEALAREAFAKACRLVEKEFSNLRAGSADDGWHDVLHCWLLHAEARQVLR
jgi:serine/threonine protein kinase/formylglycine-generating enzyme required for sulfatase activity